MQKVFGHISPDTDTVCSAIVWAWYCTEHKSEPATAYRLGELNSETQFVLEHFAVDTPKFLSDVEPNDTVAIVDTNNPQELPANISDAQITTIIDHHKLVGGLQTGQPISITTRPVASTATIIFDVMNISATELPKHISGLLLSAILSDTLGFRSPTTTEHDQTVANELVTALNLDITDFTDQLLRAKSDLSGFSDQELVTLDSKKYQVGEHNLRVSVLETTDATAALARSSGILVAIDSCVAEETDVDAVLFFIIDIIKEEAIVLTYNELTSKIIEASFNVTPQGGQATLPGILSRKKQILPVLKV